MIFSRNTLIILKNYIKLFYKVYLCNS